MKKQNKKQVTVRISDEARKKIKIKATKQDITFTAYVDKLANIDA